jgi:hypothetical protein
VVVVVVVVVLRKRGEEEGKVGGEGFIAMEVQFIQFCAYEIGFRLP